MNPNYIDSLAKIMYEAAGEKEPAFDNLPGTATVKRHFRDQAKVVLIYYDGQIKQSLAVSGYMGVMQDGRIVDRRLDPTAIPIQKNSLLGVAEPKQTDLDKVKEVVEEFLNKQGHERCWYYPTLFNKLAEVLNIKSHDCETNLPPLAEFQERCQEYQNEIYGK